MREKRQLLAIMFTDIVGYTAMMGESEPRAVAMLKKNRDLHHSFIEKFHGEYLQEIGDGTLASFESAVDAVGCALELQRVVVNEPDLNLRIGIHSGDVIAKDGDIIGDAVNVASRIEPLAATGGICISGGVYESIRNKPDVKGIFLGAKSLKNVSDPVRLYGLTGEGLPRESEIREAAEKVPSLAAAGLSMKMKLAVATLVLATIAGIGYTIVQRKSAVETASVERMSLPFPDEPSIAVLPFNSMSGDPDQEFFTDGLTEDIITGLSKVPGLFVIARNSSFTYKGKPVKVQQVSEDLGVRYVLEGSVRRVGDKVRITAQLVDALSGGHLWAENYDRDVGDVFTLMDEITMQVMDAIGVTLTAKEYADWSHDPSSGTTSLKAYEKFLQGARHGRSFNRDANLKARSFFEEATALDPEYQLAFASLADTYMKELFLGPGTDREKTWRRSMELAMKAIGFNENLADPHVTLAWLFLLVRQYEKAIAEAELAVSLNPGSSDLLGSLGAIFNCVDRRNEAIQLHEKALRLDPYPSPFMYMWAGIAYRDAERYDDAVRVCRAAVEREPDFIFGHTCLASAYSLAGRGVEARAAAAEVLRINPNFSVEALGGSLSYRSPGDLARIIDSLKSAGLPD